jgi:hypothetical protein
MFVHSMKLSAPRAGASTFDTKMLNDFDFRKERSSTATLGRHSYAEGYQGHFHQHGQQNCSDKRPQHSIHANHHLFAAFQESQRLS